MRRLPIKLRVTLAFALVMAIVLAGIAFFLQASLRDRLDDSIESALRARAGEASALVEASDEGLSRSRDNALIESDETFAEVLGTSGEVLDSSPQLGATAVLSPSEMDEALGGATFFDHASAPGIEGAVRLLAAPATAGGEDVVVVVGASLDDRDEALAGLRTLLAVGMPAALLLACLAGYGALSVALRPVEAMRRQAAEISAGEPDERLPVPAGGDELTRLGETLNSMLGRLETALERERSFVDDASHELRTPLALHKTELELALRYASTEAELRTAITGAVGEIDRLIQLAEDMLVVARSQGGLGLAEEELAVDELLGTVAQRFRARAEQAGRPLRVEGGGGVVHGDRVRLEQALTNLTDNALRHGDGEVVLSVRREDGRVELHVTDEGDGFPEGFSSQAFERFTRADSARGRGGTGLGLAIVRTIALAHGGEAGAANGPSRGADVWIAVPEAG